MSSSCKTCLFVGESFAVESLGVYEWASCPGPDDPSVFGLGFKPDAGFAQRAQVIMSVK